MWRIDMNRFIIFFLILTFNLRSYSQDKNTIIANTFFLYDVENIIVREGGGCFGYEKIVSSFSIDEDSNKVLFKNVKDCLFTIFQDNNYLKKPSKLSFQISKDDLSSFVKKNIPYINPNTGEEKVDQEWNRNWNKNVRDFPERFYLLSEDDFYNILKSDFIQVSGDNQRVLIFINSKSDSLMISSENPYEPFGLPWLIQFNNEEATVLYRMEITECVQEILLKAKLPPYLKYGKYDLLYKIFYKINF